MDGTCQARLVNEVLPCRMRQGRCGAAAAPQGPKVAREMPSGDAIQHAAEVDAEELWHAVAQDRAQWVVWVYREGASQRQHVRIAARSPVDLIRPFVRIKACYIHARHTPPQAML